jgi:PTH1 family peptidyl-tRNA hydrolase
MKVIVGLGNPGSRYAGTRHNVGFEVIDALAGSPHAGPFQRRFQCLIADMMEDAEKVLLVKPETFMNRSGVAVRQVVDFHQVPIENVLVICDDINLPLGKLRVKSRGTHGGHNGLRDIQQHLGTTEYQRLRIGVGAPQDDETVDYVLGHFRPSEKPVIRDSIDVAVQAVGVWLHQGVEACMNRYNGASPPAN